MPKPWSQVETDPDFQQLPAEEQQKVRAHYLQQAEGDANFQALPAEEQAKVRERIMPGPGLLDRAKAAMQTFSSDKGLGGLAADSGHNPDPNTPIPVLAPIAGRLDEGADLLQDSVARRLRSREVPADGLAHDAGVAPALPDSAAAAAGVATGMPARLARTVVPATMGEAANLAGQTVAGEVGMGAIARIPGAAGPISEMPAALSQALRRRMGIASRALEVPRLAPQAAAAPAPQEAQPGLQVPEAPLPGEQPPGPQMTAPPPGFAVPRAKYAGNTDFLVLGEPHGAVPPIPAQEPPPALPAPQERLALPFKQDIQGDGFVMNPTPAIREAFSPTAGDVRLAPLDAGAEAQNQAIMRRLGISKPPIDTTAVREAVGAPAAPAAPRLTRAQAAKFAADKMAVADPANLDPIVEHARAGKFTDAALKKVVDRIGVAQDRFARMKGWDDPVTQAYTQALEKLGIRRAPPPEVGPAQAPLAEGPSSTEITPGPQAGEAAASVPGPSYGPDTQAGSPLGSAGNGRAAPLPKAPEAASPETSLPQRVPSDPRIAEIAARVKGPTDPGEILTRDAAIHGLPPDHPDLPQKIAEFSGNNMERVLKLATDSTDPAKIDFYEKSYARDMVRLDALGYQVDEHMHDGLKLIQEAGEAASRSRAAEEAALAQAVRDANGGTMTPVTQAIIESGGIDPKWKAEGYAGELQDLRARPGVFREGGQQPDALAHTLSQRGLLPENATAYDMLNALQHEHANKEPLFPPQLGRPEEGRRGQGGFLNLSIGPAQNPPAGPHSEAFKLRIKREQGGASSLKDVLGKIAESAEQLFTLAVDKENPLLTKVGGKEIRWARARYLRSGQIAEQWLTNKTARILPDGSIQETGEGLRPILQHFDDLFVKRFGKGAVEDLESYMLAERDVYEAGRGKLGVDPKNAPGAIAELNAKYGPEIAKIARRIREWEDRAYIQPLVDAGVLSEESAVRLRANQYYIPYDRVMGEADMEGAMSSFASGHPIKKFSGSEKMVRSPLEAMINMTYRVAEFAERNKLLSSIVERKKASPVIDKLFPERTSAGGDTVRIFIDGEARHFSAPKDVLEAVNTLQVKGADLLTKILSIPAAMRRAGIVGDPQFALLRNPARDQLTAALNSTHQYIPWYDAGRAVFDIMRGGEHYREYQALGGNGLSMVGIDRMDPAVTLRTMRGLRELDHLNPLAVFQHLRAVGEEMTRLGVYKVSREGGMKPLEAFYEATEGTVNFDIKPGSPSMRLLNSITAFMRPSTLSTARFARLVKEAPLRTAARGTALLSVPSMALWYINKDNPEYQEAPMWVKNTCWLLPIGPMLPNGHRRLLPYPKPFAEGMLFASTPERALDYLYKKDPHAFEQYGKQLLDAFMPPIMPSGLDTIHDISADHASFTDRPIVPKSRSNMLPEDQYGDFTSETSKAIAKTAIGRRLGISPAKFDYAVQGFGGTIGRHALQLVDKGLASAGVIPPGQQDPPVADVVMARRSIGSNSESVTRFYNALDQLEREHNSAQLNSPGGAEVDRGAALEHLREVSKYMRELDQTILRLKSDKSMVPEIRKNKVDKLNEVKTKIAASAMSTLRTMQPGR